MAVSNATLLAKISALEARVTALSAKVKADETTLHPLLTSGNVAFLAGLSLMTTPLSYPLPDDPFSGSIWQTNERDYVNAPNDQLNSIVQKMQRNGLMSP
jgi:hypothetical protein